MKFPYDFGISQDDPQVETLGLDLENGTLLCIASGGEIPLSLLAKHNVKIMAIDTSGSQVRLCKLKLASALALDSHEAPAFLGFTQASKIERLEYFERVSQYLPKEDISFWKFQDLGKGPINLSRFERYISLFCQLVRKLLSQKKIHEFLELETITEQEKYFDQHLHKKIVQWIFKFAFAPSVYKNRGLDKQALRHQGKKDLAGFFYSRFRDFFTSTPARLNSYLQFYMLGEVVHTQALPAYLQQLGMEYIRMRQNQIEFQVKSIFELASEREVLPFNNYALSNISDWCEASEMDILLDQICSKSEGRTSLVLRYIHKNPVNDATRCIGFEIDKDFKRNSYSVDRFPFYSLVKASNN